MGAVIRAMVLTLFLSMPVRAAGPQDQGVSDFRSAFFKAESGQAGNIDEVVEAGEKLREKIPDHPLLLVYLGSAKAIQGRDAFFPWNKVRYVEQGCELMDQALAVLKPSDEEMPVAGPSPAIETRVVALSTFSELPELFHRSQDARRLWTRLKPESALHRLSADLRARILLSGARIELLDKKKDAAQSLLRQARTFGPSPVVLARIEALLKELE